jgi:hypothetical protein
MIPTHTLRSAIRRVLISTGVTGVISIHGAQKNLGSIKLLLKQDTYATFGIAAVHAAVRGKAITETQAIAILAESLGITPERFRQKGPGYIDPQATYTGLGRMLDIIDAAIARGEMILVATAHPGSMLTYYLRLIDYIRDRGGQVYETPEPVLVENYRWIDSIRGVHVLSDQGNLIHTHEAGEFWHFLEQLPAAPGLVLADHGYAGAAINRGIKTVAIHDVDDPGLPIAAHLGLDVLSIPLNDNQLNLPTLAAIEAILAARPTS